MGMKKEQKCEYSLTDICAHVGFTQPQLEIDLPLQCAWPKYDRKLNSSIYKSSLTLK